MLVSEWQSHQPEGVVLTRDIPSRETATLLSSMIIWEPVGDWLDARVRLMGSSLYFRFGKDVKGMLMSELFSAGEMQKHFGMLRRCMLERKPMFMHSCMTSGDVEVMQLDLVVLPIWDADGKSPLALVCIRRCEP